MSPTLYEKIGRDILCLKLKFWISTVVGILIIFGTIFTTEMIKQLMPYQIIFGVGALVAGISWGFLLIIYWFGEKSKFLSIKIEQQSGVKKFVLKFVSWYASVFLSVWFFVVIIILPMMIYKEISG
jgi:hypothetical protein